MATKEAKKLKIKLVRGVAAASKAQAKVLESLGLKKSKQTVEHFNGPTIMGMIRKVSHLVEVTDA